MRNSRWIIGLLCLLLIVVRIGGAHWHLCLDGSEPPQAMEMGNADWHADDADHHDVDLKLIGEALAKNIGDGFDVDFLAAFVLLWSFQLSQRPLLLTPYRETLFIPQVLPFHAPPRAPPR
ncbi:MAG: hypothetical protein QM709_12215 [Spongiibacteraceae bacterium]